MQVQLALSWVSRAGAAVALWVAEPLGLIEVCPPGSAIKSHLRCPSLISTFALPTELTTGT